jgi:hypothetical protein
MVNLAAVVKKVQAQIEKLGGVPAAYRITDIKATSLDSVIFDFDHESKTVIVRGKAAPPNFMSIAAPKPRPSFL